MNQIKRYEAGNTQPTLEVLVGLARALHVSLDQLMFDEGERGPPDDLRLRSAADQRLRAERNGETCDHRTDHLAR